MSNQTSTLLKDAENWLASVKGREDPQTKLIRALHQALSEPAQVNEAPLLHEDDESAESWDLYLTGRGISLLVNVPAGSQFTYAMSVDGKSVKKGTVG